MKKNITYVLLNMSTKYNGKLKGMMGVNDWIGCVYFLANENKLIEIMKQKQRFF